MTKTHSSSEQTAAETLELALEKQIEFWARRQRQMQAYAEDAASDTRMGAEYDESVAMSNVLYAARCQQVLKQTIAALRRSPGGTCATCRHVRPMESLGGELRCCDPSEANPMHWQDTPETFGCIFHMPADPQEAGR